MRMCSQAFFTDWRRHTKDLHARFVGLWCCLFPCWNAPFSAALQQRHEGTGVVINVHILSDPSVIVRELATELEPEILHGVGISIKNQTNGTYT